MLFNSNLFLYGFIPCLLFFYFLVLRFSRDRNPKWANYVLLVFSLIFYSCTGFPYLALLLVLVFANYLIGRLMEERPAPAKKRLLIAGCVVNLGALFLFKYLVFTLDNLCLIASHLQNRTIVNPLSIMLPVGISFYTFQSLSYVIDVYRDEVKVQRSFPKLLLYISFFPQLIAGPIVRYRTIQEEIDLRRSSMEDLYSGLCRFFFGLGKKVLIADALGVTVDKIFALDFANLTFPLAWAGALLYTLQIYFDFSGYSDMAIGLGRIFGFHFNENFILPYTSQNVTEFWRRWHISLSSFLRDYLYIPLGGNRLGRQKTYRNLFLVFLLCGLWHGAAWTFAVWGIYHGMFLIIERILRDRFQFRIHGVPGRVLTFLIVLTGWVFFRSETLPHALGYLKAMAGLTSLSGFQYYQFGYFLDRKMIILTLFALSLSVFPFQKIRERFRGGVLHGVCALLILLASMAYMANASFTPFIYFQF